MEVAALAQEGHLVVGLGASAGGIQALKAFFEQVPADSGAAYVVILHLSPDHDSHLATVLQTAASIPVTQVTERVRLEPNHVYVAPPDRHLEMADDELVVSPNTQIEDRRAPVDIFFRSLADSHGTRAVSVLLSGTGANGSMGLKRVKERGGVVFVQNPREAEFSEMPRNAIATGLVDEVLSADAIPERITAFRDGLRRLEQRIESSELPTSQQALRNIFTQIRVRTGHDFSNYKRPTLLRRIARRVSVRNLPDLSAYATYVQDHPEEVRFLIKDLLISVTNFFRDGKAFEAVERDLLPQLLKAKGAGDQVRTWVVGCATGEEAYSLAMLLAEHTLDVVDAPKVQIFGTDIDETALAKAREGLYTLNDAADVSPERLRRFFGKEGNAYRVRREIREMVLFARHNVLKDPPFSRLDLASCRNLLIYLNQSAQERVLETLHFALQPGGWLMLGGSESVAGASDLYASVSHEHHIYKSRAVAARQYPLPVGVSTFHVEQARESEPPVGNRAPERLTYGELHGRLLESYAPPSVVVDEEYDLVHLSERAGRYLRLAAGEPSQNLLQLIRPELRLELRGALHQAREQRTNIQARPVRLEGDEAVTLHVRPVLSTEDTSRGFILVLFEQAENEAVHETILATDEPIAKQLEHELGRLKSELRFSREQHDLQAEELRASNEELQALNEELRSAAEELETSKEELQSINEELTTVNQELKVQVEETTLVSNNLRNLINSTDIGVIFLDRSLRVQLFSPAARELFNLIPADTGRPLADITNRFEYSDLIDDAESVLNTLQGIEREMRTREGRFYLMRLLPYRTAEDRINGVVVTFVDISRRKSAEEELRAAGEKMRMIIESATDYAIFTTDSLGHVNSWNSGAQALFGYAEADILGQPFNILFTPEARKQGDPERDERAAGEEGSIESERWHLREDGSRFFGSGLLYPLRDSGGALLGSVIIMRDLTARKRAEEAVRESEVKYRSLFDSIDEGFCILEMIFGGAGEPVDYRYLETNQVFEQQTGLKDAVGKTALELVPDLERKWIRIYGRVALSGESLRFEEYSEPMGRHFDVYATPFGADSQVALVFRDITERKRREANLALVAEVADDLSRLVASDEIMRAVGSRLGEYLRLKSCLFGDVDVERGEVAVSHIWDGEGDPTADRTYRLTEYLTDELIGAQRDGEVVVICDAQNDERVDSQAFASLGVGASLSVPFHREGRWTASMTVTDAAPRDWSPAEVELVRDIAGRAFPSIERARVEEAMRHLNATLEQEVEERTQALLDSRARFEKAFDGGPLASVITTLDEDRFLETNATFTELTGYSLKEVKGRSAKELGMWSSAEDQAKIAAAMKDGNGFRHLGLSIRTKSGAVRSILISGQRINLDGGQGWLKMFLDVTDRHRTQEELLKSIEAVMSDTDWFSREVVERLALVRGGSKGSLSPDVLTARERQVLEQLANGSNDEEIATELDLKRKTVRNHIGSIYGKIGVHTRVDAVLWARERGIGG